MLTPTADCTAASIVRFYRFFTAEFGTNRMS